MNYCEAKQKLVDSNTALQNYRHRRLKHSWIKRFEKGIEDESTKNNIWKIIKRFTKHQSQSHAPVIHGRNGISYKTQDKVTAIADIY
jgi:mevalonate pyrophosphate decarboxylase